MPNGRSNESVSMGPSLRTCSTRAPGGPSAQAASSFDSASRSPAAAISPFPSDLFLTHPASRRSRAASTTYQRKPTPCTRPRISRCMLSMVRLAANSQERCQRRRDCRRIRDRSRTGDAQLSIPDLLSNLIERAREGVRRARSSLLCPRVTRLPVRTDRFQPPARSQPPRPPGSLRKLPAQNHQSVAAGR